MMQKLNLALRRLQVLIGATLLITGSSAVAAESGSPASTGLFVKISEANFKKSLMAIPPFQFNSSPVSAKNGVKVGKELFDVFKNDMEVSGFFELIKPAAFVEDVSKVGLRPASVAPGGFNFASWTQIGTEFLIRAGYHITGDTVTFESYAYYVPQQKLIFEKSYKSKISDVRTLIHTYANDLIKELTGTRGMFLSKIVTSRSTGGQEKEIFVMDWDGANSRQITNHRSISLSPTFSNSGRTIAYSSFAYHPAAKSRNVDMFTYELATGKRLIVSYRQGINSGANFTPDDKHILLTITNAGNADLYKMTSDGRNVDRLTNAKNGELYVEPAMSPDGKKIAFSTTKSGQPMIYVMNSDGSNMTRVTYAGKYNSTPAWSPDGKKIAFAGLDEDHYDIFLMDADGTNMSRLTSAKRTNGTWSHNEDPSFSPDGRNVLFRSDRTGKYQLYIVSTDGNSERRITFDSHDYFKPRWSPSFE